jgi:hypothetical protein
MGIFGRIAKHLSPKIPISPKPDPARQPQQAGFSNHKNLNNYTTIHVIINMYVNKTAQSGAALSSEGDYIGTQR